MPWTRHGLTSKCTGECRSETRLERERRVLIMLERWLDSRDSGGEVRSVDAYLLLCSSDCPQLQRVKSLLSRDDPEGDLALDPESVLPSVWRHGNSRSRTG